MAEPSSSLTLGARKKFFVIGKNAETPFFASASLSIASFLAEKSARALKVRSSAAVVCVDFPCTIKQWLFLLTTSRAKRVLIRFEPKVVLPKAQSRWFSTLFPRVLEVGRPQNASSHALNWPQVWETASLGIVASAKLPDAIIINANKMSFIKGELYSLRRLCVQSLPNVLVAGYGWGMNTGAKWKILLAEAAISLTSGHLPNIEAARGWFSPPLKALGSTLDKRAMLARFRYSIVIENSLEFMTEKLFDCFFARTIPIYVGPSVANYGIPANLVIQSSPTIESIMDGLIRAQTVDYESWERELLEWLNNPTTKENWDALNSFEKILSFLETVDQ